MGRKVRKELGNQLNEAAADVTMDFGRRMLAKFGWAEGKGLGKNEDGVVDHVRVKQRAHQLGLGASAEMADVGFAQPQMSVIVKDKKRKKDKMDKEKKKKKKDKLDDDGSEPERKKKKKSEGNGASNGVVPGMSDEALFVLCGGVRLGRRAGMPQVGKEKRIADADAAFLAKYGGGVTASAADYGGPIVSAAPVTTLVTSQGAGKASGKGSKSASGEVDLKIEKKAKLEKRKEEKSKRHRAAS